MRRRVSRRAQVKQYSTQSNCRLAARRSCAGLVVRSRLGLGTRGKLATVFDQKGCYFYFQGGGALGCDKLF